MNVVLFEKCSKSFMNYVTMLISQDLMANNSNKRSLCSVGDVYISGKEHRKLNLACKLI